MACIGKQKTASGIRFYVQLSPGENYNRPKIALGRVSRKEADTARTNIENLIASKKTGAVIPSTTQKWLSDIPDSLRDRFHWLCHGRMVVVHRMSISRMGWGMNCHLPKCDDSKVNNLSEGCGLGTSTAISEASREERRGAAYQTTG